jgi:MerR family copper efflux transcriptional regulator
MLTIGVVARQVGVHPWAIRYYEAQGILRPADRRPNGYRVYTDDTIKLLLFVRRAQALGITLKEIKPLLNLATQGQQPCKHVKELARNHLREINIRSESCRRFGMNFAHCCGVEPPSLTETKFVHLSRATRNRIFDIVGEMGQLILALVFVGAAGLLS